MSDKPPPDAPDLRVTMVRCSTLLLEAAGGRILTDPWFAMHLHGLPCYRRPGLRAADLPPLDALLVSHLHPDHFDAAAVRRLKPPPATAFFPPGGLAKVHAPADGWRELAPGQQAGIGPITVTAVPGPHTLPGPDEVNFVLRIPVVGTVFFGGDARFDAVVLAEVGRTHGPFRLALLPVGGTRILGRRTVMGPADALAAADLLGAQTIVPIHEGGLWASVPPLSMHPGRASHLAQAAERRGEPARVVVLQEGESLEL